MCPCMLAHLDGDVGVPAESGGAERHGAAPLCERRVAPQHEPEAVLAPEAHVHVGAGRVQRRLHTLHENGVASIQTRPKLSGAQ